MVEKYYCGRCGSEFIPKPYFYGGESLCDGCREAAWPRIKKAKEAYDRMSPEERQDIDFASAVSNALPNASSVDICMRCGATISGGRYCRSCQRKVEREERRAAEKYRKAKDEFEGHLSGL